MSGPGTEPVLGSLEQFVTILTMETQRDWRLGSVCTISMQQDLTLYQFITKLIVATLQ